MPGIINDSTNSRKRKRQGPTAESCVGQGDKARKIEKESSKSINVEEEILLLEIQILESRRHYNKISTLINYCQNDHALEKYGITAAVALCRIFCRLMVVGNLSKPRDAPDNETIIVHWLRSQLDLYTSTLLDLLITDDPGTQSTALTLLMRLLKEKSDSLDLSVEKSWRDGAFPKLISSIVSSRTTNTVREEFVVKYLQPYDDVRCYAFACLNDLFSSVPSEVVLDNVIFLLTLLRSDSADKRSDDCLYVARQAQSKHKIKHHAAHRKQAQELWLKVLKSDLSKSQRKIILSCMAQQIAPWFTRLELLMDFLTHSFNAGGSMSLSALSGLFHLMQEKNLDYPQFYTKLYSLLSSDVLHSKHRSRFFRLLNTFLSSTHLPAALVASFIKRLSRLALFAPPAGIVVIIPWTYNLLKNHPSCTFMIHRKLEFSAAATGKGMDDPFDMEESDPMGTHAIDSSLWEIHTLQEHYNPNVAAIAKIISEQFTKQSFDIEDFLDHSYSSMLSAELSKEIKKPPVVEHDIPKKIFLENVVSPEKDRVLVKLWDFN